jgi:hypothetical protein
MLANESCKLAAGPLNTVQDARSAACQRPANAATALSVNGIGNSNNFKTDIITDPVIESLGVIAGRSREGSMAQEPENRSWTAVKSQAKALAMFIEECSVNLGAYIKLIREYDGRTILAGVIATLMRKHFPCGRGPLKRPGGFFTRRCQEFQRDGIPSEVAAWIERCGHLSYQEIDAALEAASRVRPRMDDCPPVRLQSVVPDAIPTPIYPPGQGDWMSRTEAGALEERISKEDQSVGVKQIQRVCLAAGEVYVVEVVVDGVPYVFASECDWENYRSRLRAIEEADKCPEPEEGWGVWNT